MAAFKSKTPKIVTTITSQFVSGFKEIHTRFKVEYSIQFVKCLSWWVGVI